MTSPLGDLRLSDAAERFVLGLPALMTARDRGHLAVDRFAREDWPR